MILFETGSENQSLSTEELRSGFYEALAKLGPRNRVLLVPPDHTRFHSRAGLLTVLAYEYYGDRVKDILPALGTHSPMGPGSLKRMFPGIPEGLFRIHDWRKDVITLGEISSDFIREVSGGLVSYSWPVQLNRLLVEGQYDLILSLGQVVPHEVIGMANYNKNLLIGCGGPEGINKSHFLGAVYGMERIMGRTDNPVRRVLNHAEALFLKDLPVVYAHTVVGPSRREESGGTQVRGLYVGYGTEVFTRPADLSLRVNFSLLDQPITKVVTYLNPTEYQSTWLGNKAIYRTRMAIADGGELVILAPGVRTFGEDPEIDRLIRAYGYCGTPAILEAVKKQPELERNLSAAAHLIHGSSEGRFRITWCPGELTREEVTSAGFDYGDPVTMNSLYPVDELKEGYNLTRSGEEIFYISNPALGLWSTRERFHETGH